MGLKKKGHGVGTAEEAFGAEMRDGAGIAGLLAKDTDKPSGEEVGKPKAELEGIMKKSMAGKDEHATRFLHLLADRIPMAGEQIWPSIVRFGREPPHPPILMTAHPDHGGRPGKRCAPTPHGCAMIR